MNVNKEYKVLRDKLLEDSGIQFQSKYVRTTGPVENVHYLELGTGSPVIMVHGGGSHSGEWLDILKALAKNFHLFVVDRPGCGLTEAIDYRGVDLQASAVDFIHSFMNAISLDKVHLTGHSIGGYFSICFALKHPERVKKLLLIGAPGGMNLWIPPSLRLMGTKFLNRILIRTISRPSLKSVRSTYHHLLVEDDANLSDDFLRLCYLSQLLPGAIPSFLTLLENTLTQSGWKRKLYIGDKLNQLKIPVRFIWGDKDVFEKPESGKLKAKYICNHRFEVVENAGHCVWLDQPEKCSFLAIEMLKD